MFCLKCKSQIPGNARFCNICGAEQKRFCTQCGTEIACDATFCKECGAPIVSEPYVIQKKTLPLSTYFLQSYSKKYANFSACASRKEFWGTYLFTFLVFLLLFLLYITAAGSGHSEILIVAGYTIVVLQFLTIIPLSALCFRRALDLGDSKILSGICTMLFVFIPLILSHFPSFSHKLFNIFCHIFYTRDILKIDEKK